MKQGSIHITPGIYFSHFLVAHLSEIFFLFLIIPLELTAYASGEKEWKNTCQDGVVGYSGYPVKSLLKKSGYEIEQWENVKDGNETPQLVEIRELEELLFPPPPAGQKIFDILNLLSGIFSGIKSARDEQPQPEDLAWVLSLRKPDLDFIWHVKLIRFLKKFRDDGKWNSILRSWFERREIYGKLIREELLCRKLPSSLQYVPMVESGYNVGSVSRAGAAGIWQFMPSTARVYGLAQTTWVDQRLNPELSTVAAIEYIASLKKRFGSWTLALAAYNAGYATIINAIKKYNTNDYWRLSEIEGGLPWETTNYVPRIIAVAIAGKNPEEFGLENIKFMEPVNYNLIQIPVPLHISKVAQAAGITVDDLRKLNPELKKNRIPPEFLPYPVRLPDFVDMSSFEFNFKKICEEFKPVELYRVRFGENLKKISRNTGVSVKELCELNELDKEEKLQTGTVILIPSAAKKAHSKSSEEKKVVIVPENSEFEFKGKKRIFYEIIKGDTLNEISHFFKVSIGELVKLNGLDPSASLIPGMVLQIFIEPDFDLSNASILNEEQVTVIVSGSKEHLEYIQKNEGKKRVVYRASRGETIEAIANRFKVNPHVLKVINNLQSVAVPFKGGEEVVLYVTPAVFKKHFTGTKISIAGGNKADGSEEKGNDIYEDNRSAELTNTSLNKIFGETTGYKVEGQFNESVITDNAQEESFATEESEIIIEDVSEGIVYGSETDPDGHSESF